MPKPFRLRYLRTGQVTYPPGATFGPRVAVDFEFVWIQQGDVQYRANGTDYQATPGTVLLSQPGFAESFQWDRHGPTRHGYFHFAFDHPPAAWGERTAWPICQRFDRPDIVRPLFEFLITHGKVTPQKSISTTLHAAAETILSAFILGPATQQPAGSTSIPEPVQRAITYLGKTLTANPAARLALSDLARAAAVDPRHLCRLFAQSLDLSPMDAVTIFRMNHALNLLARTDYKLERIAEQCGFANAFHFSRRFKQHFGHAPRLLRRQAAEGKLHVSTHFHLVPSLAIDFGAS
jgi:AraC family transcriptional regulator